MSVQPFETRHRVWGYDCGYGGPFSPLAMADYFQEIAGDHAATLGVGMGSMFAQGRTWMLSRVDIKAEALPKSGDEVLLRTWPAGTDRLFALRCIEMVSSSGELLAGALYEYLIVDMEKRKPLRPERILDPGMKCELPRPYPDLAPGLHDHPAFAGKDRETVWTESFRLSASPRHIDYNGHVNNAHIINWLCDAVPKAERIDGRAARIKVDFVAELRLGEEITALYADGGPTSGGAEFLSLLMRGDEVVARALTRWI